MEKLSPLAPQPQKATDLLSGKQRTEPARHGESLKHPKSHQFKVKGNSGEEWDEGSPTTSFLADILQLLSLPTNRT